MEKINKITNTKRECCGCSSCLYICPKKAIRMTNDDLGFKYPSLDEKLCINCGLCSKVCSFTDEIKLQEKFNQQYFLVKNKNIEIRESSRSGGVFSEISDYILELGGVVYGARFNSSLEVVHSRAETKKQRDSFRGSKYVQSNLNEVFPQIINDLESGLVLFSGTPCQVSNLKKYIKVKNKQKLLNNLYTCDIICHGVISPKFWKENLTLLSQGKEISEPNFRDKSYGWDTHVESYKINNQKVSSTLYTLVFYSHAFLRDSCYNCSYTQLNRVSDITLGDAWGVEREYPEFNDNKGVSLIMVNTLKGDELLKNKLENLNFIHLKKIDPFLQPQLKAPVVKPKDYRLLRKIYEKCGFGGVAHYLYSKKSLKGKLSKIKKWLLRFLNITK